VLPRVLPRAQHLQGQGKPDFNVVIHKYLVSLEHTAASKDGMDVSGIRQTFEEVIYKCAAWQLRLHVGSGRLL
jgi:hypothetical protein